MRKTDETALIKKFQKLLGLDKFKITTKAGELHDEQICRADCDFTDMNIVITKGDYFRKAPEQSQRNVLIHELIEARILWMEQKVEDKTESIIYEEREELVNELAKALENIK